MALILMTFNHRLGCDKEMIDGSYETILGTSRDRYSIVNESSMIDSLSKG
jgi:hypothetical protein